MVFNNPNIQRIARIFRVENDSKTSSPSPTAAKNAERGDSVNLSQEAKMLAAIKQRLAEAPEIRREKVEALKALIADGTYDVSADNIAEAMLSEGKL